MPCFDLMCAANWSGRIGHHQDPFQRRHAQTFKVENIITM